MPAQAPTRTRIRPQTVTESAAEEIPIETLLTEAISTNFDDETDWKKFQEKHRARLTKNDAVGNSPSGQAKDEVLHVLAEKRIPLGQHRNFLKWAIKTHGSLLECKSRDRARQTPLHRAIREKNHEFVQLVLDNVDDGRAVGLLQQKTDFHENCLHYAIKHSSPFTEWIISITSNVLKDPPKKDALDIVKGQEVDFFRDTSNDPDYEGMTALHIALDMDDKPSSNVIKTAAINTPLVKQPNPKHDSSASVKTEGAIHPPEKGVANIRARRAYTEAEEPKTILQTPVSQQDLGSLGKAKDFDRLQVVVKLIDAAKRVLVDCKDAYSDTPFQTRFACREAKDQRPDDANKVEAWRQKIIETDPILLYMRKYIIDRFSRKDAMTALYKIGDERALEFDLTGLPFSTINADFLKGLGKVLRFEGLLKYVALPSLIVEDDDLLGLGEINAEDMAERGRQDRENPAQNEASKSKGKGIQNFYPIFGWLKKRNVKSVLTVTVVDNVEPSHSDEAIEACMRTLNVQSWNWYKMDLCCDVIVNSAKSVKDVTLYSSGNNAVLIGWSSSAGLAKLEEGLERLSRLKGYMKSFEEELKGKHKRKVKFTWDLLKSDPSYNSVFTNRGAEKAVESKWMKSMTDFAEFLKTTKRDNSIDHIKIAIIDDGINMAQSNFADNVKGGESFYRLSELSGRRGAYYAPTGPHGTMMAQLICEVCPVADIYIAQLELLPGQDGRRAFTAESAAEAISWAAKNEVDIISMSWSISTSRPLLMLKDAIEEAKKKNIILFCASIDEGATTFDNTYPGKIPGCIKIGACTGTGAKLSWVSEKDSDFFLPGEVPQPASEPNVWSHSHMGSFGSSVSTALAAGLAGVLLYCDRLIGTPHLELRRDRSNPEVGSISRASAYMTEEIEYLKCENNMDIAFMLLSKVSDTRKFPQVWDDLPRSENLKWRVEPGDEATIATKEELRAFMKRLKSNS